MKIISFINIKGGVGKTSSAATVAHMMATKYNKKVLLVDVDPQGNSSSVYSSIDSQEILEAMLQGDIHTDPNRPMTVQDILLDPSIDTHQCIYPTAYDNLNIIPALITLSEGEEKMKANVRDIVQFRLRDGLRKVQDEYDYCIIDCSPAESIINVNALACSNVVYIPMRCDAWSAMGMVVARNLLTTIHGYNPALQYGGCFLTQWNGRKIVSQTVVDLLDMYVKDELLDIRIRQSKLVEEMSYTQTPILALDPKEKVGVTKDFIKLTEHIMKDVED